jgi:hypothetical protein
MTRFGRSLLPVEVTVCFLPICVLLFLGILMVPMQVAYLATPRVEYPSALLSLVSFVAAGVAGLVALCFVMRWLMYGIRAGLNPKIVVLLMCAGALPLIYFAAETDGFLGRLFYLLPLLCTAHLVWLSQSYLFGAKAQSD